MLFKIQYTWLLFYGEKAIRLFWTPRGYWMLSEVVFYAKITLVAFPNSVNCEDILISYNTLNHIGVRVQSTLGARHFCPKICVWQIYKSQNALILHYIFARKMIKMPEFVIFAGKFNQIPDFYMLFSWQMSEFYMIIARKLFPVFFSGGGGDGCTCPCPSSPTPMVDLQYWKFSVRRFWPWTLTLTS